MAKIQTSVRGWGSPSRYFQGPGLLMELSKYTGIYGTKAFAIIDQFFFEKLTGQLQEQFAAVNAQIDTVIFNSEVTEARIEIAAQKAKASNPDVIVAIGGGKTIDTSKAVADILNVPIIVVPTSASTDAPTIALSVLYSEEGKHIKERHYKTNPDIVLMDSQIIAQAPARFLVAGMGDALSTVFEARASVATDSANFVSGGYRGTKTGLMIAELCYDTLMKNGLKALQAAEHGIVTEALEDVIEVNTLMSGLGVENNGCAGSHSICEGISVLPEDSKTFHGEKVGFGVICQLMAENAPLKTLQEILSFSVEIGLPITLDDLFIKNTSENIHAIAQQSMKSYWQIEPFFINADMVANAITAADEFGKRFRNNIGGAPAYTHRNC
ncbi:MAG: glycerol dehydrogenase [Christensenella sp.]